MIVHLKARELSILIWKNKCQESFLKENMVELQSKLGMTVQ